MPNYKDLYLHMIRETEKAVRILVSAQRDCEEAVLQGADVELVEKEQERRSV